MNNILQACLDNATIQECNQVSMNTLLVIIPYVGYILLFLGLLYALYLILTRYYNQGDKNE